jgi:hypothetical protein
MQRRRCATFVDLLLTRVLFDAEDRIVVVAGDALHSAVGTRRLESQVSRASDVQTLRELAPLACSEFR